MKKRLVALAVLAAIGVAACGGDDDDTTAEPADEPAAEPAAEPADEPATDGVDSSKPTIKLIVNPWSASRLNVEVAKNIIESELGYPVEITEVNENDAMFTGMADGSLDAVLEIWPSGITDDENAYFDDGTVVHLGDLGAVGRIGWFVPQYVIDEHPELATWEGFTTPEAAALFATAEIGRPRSLPRHRPVVLAVRRADHRQPRHAVRGAVLRFRAGDDRRTRRPRLRPSEPVVMYWWTPTAAVAKYDLVKVELPAVHRRVHRVGGRLGRRVRVRLPGGRADQGCFCAARREGAGRVRVPADVHDHDRRSARDAAGVRDRRR